MKAKLLIFGMLMLLLSATALPSATMAKPNVKGKNPFADIPITGTVEGGGVMDGLFTIDHFEVVGNQMMAVGTFSGTVAGQKAKDVPLSLPATLSTGGAAASDTLQALQVCPILNLTLGPIDLNLLGLRVQTNQIVVNITAESGPGNLLGNLLCAVAGLLDGTGLLGDLTRLLQVANLLNAILDLFQNL